MSISNISCLRPKLKQIEYHGYIPDLEREIPLSDNQRREFGEVATEWATIKKSKVSETTYHAYQKAMNTHVLPQFGNRLIDQITSLEIEKFLSNLKCSPKTDGSHRDVRFFSPVDAALLEQKKRTFKGNPENFVFLNKKGNNIHRHTLNRYVIKPTLVKAGLGDNRSIKDTRASYITNCLDNGERISFVQRQVGHVNTKMIIEHYYRNVSAPDDGSRLAEAWNSTSILPEEEMAKT